MKTRLSLKYFVSYCSLSAQIFNKNLIRMLTEMLKSDSHLPKKFGLFALLKAL